MICLTCDMYLKKKKKITPEAVWNKLNLPCIPEILSSFKKLKRMLIGRIILFKKVSVMLKGRFPTFKGSTCNISIKLANISIFSSGLIAVNLKRKLSYHSYAYFETVHPASLYQALVFFETEQYIV